MIRRHLPLLPCSVATAVLMIVGCGGGGPDLDEAYGLNDPANQVNQASNVAMIIDEMESRLRGREYPPKQAVDAAVENLESFRPEAFGDQAAAFEKIKAGVMELKKAADANKPKNALLEMSGSLKDQADQLAAAGKPAAAAQ